MSEKIKRNSLRKAQLSHTSKPSHLLTDQDKITIINMNMQHHSNGEIARKLFIHKSTVARILKHYKKHKSIARRKGSGRKCKIINKMAKALRRNLEQGKIETTKDCMQYVQAHFGIIVSEKTMRTTLKKHSLFNYIKQKKPFLTEENREERVSMAQEWKTFTKEDWERTTCSDEKMFGQDKTGHKLRVWLPYPAPFNERRMLPVHPFGGIHVRIWAAIYSKGFLAYELYEEPLTAKSYIGILKRNLLKKAKETFKGLEEWTFQQDNASYHVTDDVFDFLEEKSIHVLHWPSRSPDLNLIENVWTQMQREMTGSNPQTVEDLRGEIKRVIDKMNAEESSTHYFHNLYESMPKRVEEVLAAHGAPINR